MQRQISFGPRAEGLPSADQRRWYRVSRPFRSRSIRICCSNARTFSPVHRMTASQGAFRDRARLKTWRISASVKPRLWAFRIKRTRSRSVSP